MTRVLVPLDKNMTDEEIVQALKDAEKKANEEAEPTEETPVDGESDE
jgi:DNA-binding protein YbaB